MKVALALTRLRGPLLAVGAGLLLGAMLMLVTGHDPVAAYGAMLHGAFGGRNAANLVATLNRAVPIVGMGLAAATAFRAGLFNIGGEGQLLLGAMAAAVVALYLPLPSLLVMIAAGLAATAVGGAYAWIAAYLEFRFRMPLLVSSLLMIYPARSLTSYLVSHPLRDTASGMTQTLRIPAEATLPRLAGTRLQAGLLVILVLVFAAHWLIARTGFGYHLRLTGLNRSFTRYGGVDVRRLGSRVMLLSGSIAGVVGATQVLGVHARFIDGALTQPLYAWVGIMVALLAGSRPIAVLVAGVFFAALQTGGFGMERATEVPRELSQVLQALIILFVAAGARFSCETQAAAEAR